MATALKIENLVLKQGAHPNRENGLCFMEAAAWLAGRPHSDHPECVSPIIGTFMRRWNDDLDDVGRQRLKPLLPLVLNTVARTDIEQRRGWMCADWMVRIHTPAWLRLAGLNDQAQALESLPEISDVATLRGAVAGPLEDARNAAAAAGAAAGAAARAAAGKKLEPTKLSLQDSALDLVKRMCALRLPEEA